MRLLWLFLFDVVAMICMSRVGAYLFGFRPFSVELVAILAFVCTYLYNEENKKK